MSASPKPAHSEVGASIAKRWMHCPASVKEAKKYPAQVQSDDAALGTVAHHILELALMKGEQPKKFLNSNWTVSDGICKQSKIGRIKFGQDSVESVEFAVGYVQDKIKELQAAGRRITLHVETEFELRDIDDRMFGTADIVLAEPLGNVWVMDYKHGTGVMVDATENPQLAFYALGASSKFGCQSATVTIIQPRGRGDRVREVELSGLQLSVWEQQFKEAAIQTRLDNPPFGPGEDQCRWCPAAVGCEARLKWQADKIGGMFEDHGAKGVQVTMPTPSLKKSPEQLARLLEGIPVIEAWLAAANELKRSLIEMKSPPPGWVIAPGKKGNRKWSSEAEVEGSLTLLGVDAFEKTLLSPTALQKKFPSAYDSVAALVVTPEGRPTLKREVETTESDHSGVEALFEKD